MMYPSNILKEAKEGGKKELVPTLQVPEEILDERSGTAYVRREFLGKGATARCYVLEEKSGTSQQKWAGKIIAKTSLKKTNFAAKIGQEIDIISSLKHENIVAFRSHFEDKHFVYIIFELCTRCTLLELHKRRGSLTLPECKYFLRQIVSGVRFLHAANVVHRDLKLANLLLDESITVKIGDFGLATRVDQFGTRKLTLCGTPNYIAPEIVTRRGHGSEVDIWSVGCILYTLLVGNAPFHSKSTKETFRKILKCEFTLPADMDPDAMEVLTATLCKDYTLRPSADDLMSHRFFENCPPSLPTSVLAAGQNMDQGKIAEVMERMSLFTITHPRPKDSVIVSRWSLDPQHLARLAHLRELLASAVAMNKVLPRSSSGKSFTVEEGLEKPQLRPLVWVSSWIDKSDKYGFVYKLSDSSHGMLFNDSSSLHFNSAHSSAADAGLPSSALGGALYMHSDGSEMLLGGGKEHPVANIAKKMGLLRHFSNKIRILVSTGAIQADELKASNPRYLEVLPRPPVLVSWRRSKSCLVMMLSNGTLQVNFFGDHVKLILCPLVGAVSLVTSGGAFATYALADLAKKRAPSRTLRLKMRIALQKINATLIGR